MQASLVNWFPLGFWLGDGRGRWRWRAPLFPTELSSVFQAQQLSLPASSCPPHSLRAELLTYNIPDVKSHWLSELTESRDSTFASQTSGALPCPTGCSLHRPGYLLPVCVAHTASLPFLSSSKGLLSTPAPESAFCYSSGSFLGYLGRCGWNLSDQQSAVSPGSSYPSSSGLVLFKWFF